MAIENTRIITEELDDMWGSIFQDICIVLTNSRARYLLPTFLLSFGVFLTTSDEIPSTYVCSIGNSSANSIVVSQSVGAFIDFVIVVYTWRLLTDGSGDRRKLSILSSILLYSAAIFSLLGIASLLYDSYNLGSTYSLGLSSMTPTLTDGTALAIALLFFMYFISKFRPLSLITAFVFIWLYIPLTQAIWTNFSPFPPKSKGPEVVGFLLLVIGFTSFAYVSSVSEMSITSHNFLRGIPTWIYTLLMMSLLVTESIYLSKTVVVGFHPINFLVYNARIDGDRWLTGASSSISLETAVAEYRSRYRGRAPPPNFDKWYNFAKERGCAIIDDYDQIDRDLLPFWALEPSQVRSRSPLQLSSNDIFAIRIAEGLVEIPYQGNIDHSRLSDDIVAMISTFAQWLPDMYIAFNLMDVPRVAVPWKRIDKMKRQALTMDPTLSSAGYHNHFTSCSALNCGWSSLEMDPTTTEKYDKPARKSQRSLDPRSLPSVFEKREALSCPISSPSGRNRAWHSQGFCASCVYPHSLGQFVQNWTLAGDLCHQPDMANLHGFLMSPATTFDVGYSQDQLVPMFSRSKISGYNDILFPGPWDYADVRGPKPSLKTFSEMANTLFWRGPADGSESTSHKWRGMIPQRLAHLANNLSSNSLVPILLPVHEGEFIYERVPAGDLAGLLHLDIGLTTPEPCKTEGCLEQECELGAGPDIPFEEHFNYRYLFDTDTPGASKRFISFLRSNGVPFRTSIFRFWYDDRLTPWLHYVPLDSRLHAVHSTLAYFAGLKGTVNGRKVEMQAKFQDAAFIADQGRKWVEKAIRREDAETYMFRLLLEYGRVIDDRRNEIGFQFEANDNLAG